LIRELKENKNPLAITEMPWGFVFQELSYKNFGYAGSKRSFRELDRRQPLAGLDEVLVVDETFANLG